MKHYMNIIEKAELPILIHDIDRFSKSEIMTCNLSSHKSDGEEKKEKKHSYKWLCFTSKHGKQSATNRVR